MTFALACASHSPVMLDLGLSDQETCCAVEQSFVTMREFIEGFDPELIIQFAPDHFHGFNYRLMPSFCIGVAARSHGDWHTRAEPLPVSGEDALALLHSVRAAEIDAAVSHDMVVDHGFVQMWDLLFGRTDRYPLVPVFVNCAAPPLPAYRRLRYLGQSVGQFARSTGKRVLFAASGGLSHDPLVPRIETAPPEVRARLLGQIETSTEQHSQREQRLLSMAAMAKQGEGPIRPLNPAWDHQMLDLLSTADWKTFDAFDTEEVDRIAGSGANELLAWVAATAALAATGPFEVVQRDYRPAPGWIAGVAHLAARGISVEASHSRFD